jgi:hypothetical protein
MTNIINLHSERKARLRDRAQGVTLCQSGFHKWKTVTGQRFDVRQGKLITIVKTKGTGVDFFLTN